jgi:hypothetical protein
MIRNAQHELHDLFVLYFFHYVLRGETQGAMENRPPGKADAIDFVCDYYLNGHELEQELTKADRLLGSCDRGGRERRPLVAWLEKRFYVHDFEMIPADKAMDAQRLIENALASADEDTGDSGVNAASPKKAYGCWHPAESVEDALLVFLAILKRNYRSEFEDYTPVRELCEKLGV